MHVSRALGAGLLAFALSGPWQQTFHPVQFRSGGVPRLPQEAVGGGEVFLEVMVDRAGRVTGIRPLRTTPPYTDLVIDAVRDWRFTPATDMRDAQGRPEQPRRTPVASTVLVAGAFRPPALRGPTLGGRPETVAPPLPETVFPLSTKMPTYPPAARFGGVVLLEALIDRDGALAGVKTVIPAPPFDDAARSALHGWRFRPARREGTAVSTAAYVLFGFRAPVVLGPGGVAPPGPAVAARPHVKLFACPTGNCARQLPGRRTKRRGTGGCPAHPRCAAEASTARVLLLLSVPTGLRAREVSTPFCARP